MHEDHVVSSYYRSSSRVVVLCAGHESQILPSQTSERVGYETRALHAGQPPDCWTSSATTSQDPRVHICLPMLYSGPDYVGAASSRDSRDYWWI